MLRKGAHINDMPDDAFNGLNSGMWCLKIEERYPMDEKGNLGAVWNRETHVGTWSEISKLLDDDVFGIAAGKPGNSVHCYPVTEQEARLILHRKEKRWTRRKSSREH